MSPAKYTIERDDVRIEPIEPPMCQECEQTVATHRVLLNLRAIGTGVYIIGNACLDCATEAIERLHVNLPDEW